MLWRWRLWRGRLRDAVLPFSMESQEDFLRRVGNEAVALHDIHIVASFRGCRKTKSAERVAFRSSYLWPLFPCYWRRRYFHIKNITQYQSLFTSENSQLVSRYKERLWAYVVRASSAGVFTLMTTEMMRNNASAVVSGGAQVTPPEDATSAATGPLTPWQRLAAWLPSPDDSIGIATFFVFFFALVRRRKVFIIDDVLRYRMPHGHRKANLEAMLDDIKALGRSSPVILLSSNEGIAHLFSDRNTTTFAFSRMPPAHPEELLLALQKYNYQEFSSLTMDAFHGVIQQYGMIHHACSARWWICLHQHFCGRRQTPDVLSVPPSRRGAGSPEFVDDFMRHLNLHRDAMISVAVDLDLQCEEAGRPFALAYSESTNVAESLRGYFSTIQIRNICNKLAPMYNTADADTLALPRRLILAAALLVTVSPANTDDARFLWQLEEAIRERVDKDDVFLEDFECKRYLHPLRQLLRQTQHAQ